MSEKLPVEGETGENITREQATTELTNYLQWRIKALYDAAEDDGVVSRTNDAIEKLKAGDAEEALDILADDAEGWQHILAGEMGLYDSPDFTDQDRERLKQDAEEGINNYNRWHSALI